MQTFKQAVFKNFLTGLSVLVPLYLTIYILASLVGLFDRMFDVLPASSPLTRFRFPGLGLILAFVLASTVGLVVRNFVGRNFFRVVNSAIERVPVVASIYSLLRQVSEAMLGEGTKSFSRVIMVEWPRRECWVMAFVTADSQPMLVEAMHQKGRWLNVFVPTTPNPTSGFYFMVPEADVIDVPISVDQAFKVIISAGSFPLEPTKVI